MSNSVVVSHAYYAEDNEERNPIHALQLYISRTSLILLLLLLAILVMDEEKQRGLSLSSHRNSTVMPNVSWDRGSDELCRSLSVVEPEHEVPEMEKSTFVVHVKASSPQKLHGRHNKHEPGRRQYAVGTTVTVHGATRHVGDFEVRGH